MKWKSSIRSATAIKTFNDMKHCIQRYLLTTVSFLTTLHAVNSQPPDQQSPEVIAVIARPSTDSITLRWAPMRFNVWQLGNVNGYRVERYVLARNGSLLTSPEKQILHAGLKPNAEEYWEGLVKNEKYAAIAAQALFGDRFEIDVNKTGVVGIVNKVRENEQRFSFALFSADMSAHVARASGLMFTDRNVDVDEKYLYRIVINAGDTLRGSVFVSPGDRYELPTPQNVTGDFEDAYVHLKWDKSDHFRYTAYRVERSQDGINFRSISDSPLVTVSPSQTEDTRHHYAVDSLPNPTDIFYYRVKGLTPFGEQSPPSNVISGTAQPVVQQVPYISAVQNVDNKSLHIRWDFPAENNNAIKGFTLERTSLPNGSFMSLAPKILPPSTREYEDNSPELVNYYRIIALGQDGGRYPSPLFYGQLVDSIPPAFPVGLSAIVHESGVVELTWKPNQETDIYGYRVYKANYSSEELAQLTTSPITSPFIVDTVNVNTLNEHVYYSVMAIDRNQNHSKLSATLKVQLPDKVAPQPPVLLPVKSNGDGVILSWITNPADDVTDYILYRKTVDARDWERVVIIKKELDTVYAYIDEHTPSRQVHFYTVVAIDDAGLESAPADPVSGTRIDTGLQASVQWRKPVMLREENQVTLRWKYDLQGVAFYRLYKASLNNPPVLHTTIREGINEFKDTLIPTENYTYRIMAVFANGQKSAMSVALYVDY
jgi:hypothetical protein